MLYFQLLNRMIDSFIKLPISLFYFAQRTKTLLVPCYLTLTSHIFCNNQYSQNSNDFLYTSSSNSLENDLLYFDEEKKDFQTRLNRLRERINSNRDFFTSERLNFGNHSAEEANFNNEEFSRNEVSSKSPEVEKNDTIHAKEESPVEVPANRSSKSFSGVYFIPFLGASIPGELSWKTPLGKKHKIDQDLGFSLGADVGYQWKYLYSSIGATFNRSSLNAIEIGGPKISYEGTEYLLNMDFNLGARFNLNRFTTFNLGVGLGGCFQQFSSTFAKALDHEDYDLLGTYNFHTSLGFKPGDHWFFALGYKLLHTTELEFYTARNLHILQISGTYIF